MFTLIETAEMRLERRPGVSAQSRLQVLIKRAYRIPHLTKRTCDVVLFVGLIGLFVSGFDNVQSESFLWAPGFWAIIACLGLSLPFALQEWRFASNWYRKRLGPDYEALFEMTDQLAAGELTAISSKNVIVDRGYFRSAIAILLFSEDEDVRKLVRYRGWSGFKSQLILNDPAKKGRMFRQALLK